MDENNRVSLNAATLDELKTLDGIGSAKAQAIIDYRQKNGDFKSIDEVKNVRGIGNATFSKIEDRITLLSKRELIGRRISVKIANKKNVIAVKSKDAINIIKSKIDFTLLKGKETIYNTEIATLNKLNTAKNFTVQAIDKAILNGKFIKAKAATQIGKIAKVSKDVLELFKQELSIEKNTIRFKEFMTSIEARGLQAQNRILGAVNTAKEKVNEVKGIVKDNVSKVKYNLIDKAFLAKTRISVKFQTGKNFIATKTKDQVEFTKQNIKNWFVDKKDRIKEIMSVDSEKLQENKERIANLREERDKLINDLFSRSGQSVSMGR